MSDVQVTLQLSGDAAELEAALARIQTGLKGVGAAGAAAGAQAAAGTEPAVGSANRVAGAASAAGAALGRMGVAGATGGAAVSSAANQAGASLNTLTGIAENARSAIYGVFIINRGLDYLKSLADIADGYTNLTSKLRNVTSNEGQLTDVRQKLFNISQETRTSLDATVSLYTRFERATTSLNLTQDQTLKIVSNVNKALTLGGATTEESSRAIIQLTQALNLGVLKGQDFNSVASQAPVILKLLSESMNVPIAQLKQLGSQGKITSEQIAKALLNAGASIDGPFANITTTIDGALTRVHNALEKYIGDANEAGGAGKDIAAGLTSLATNFNTIADAAIHLGEALALVYGGKALGSFFAQIDKQASSVKAIYDTNVALQAQKVALADAAAAEAAYAINVQMETEARVANSVANSASLESKLAIASADAAAAAAAELKAEADLAAQGAASRRAQSELTIIANLGEEAQMSNVAAAAQQRYTDAQFGSVVAAAELQAAKALAATTTGALTGLQQAATAASLEEAAALQALSAALLEVAAAEVAAGEAAVVAASGSAALATVAELAAAAGTGLLAMVGGIPTIVLAAGVALYVLATQMDDIDKKNKEVTDSNAKLAAQSGNVTEALKSESEKALTTAQALRDQIAAKLDDELASEAAATAGNTMGDGMLYIGTRSAELAAQLLIANKNVADLTKSMRFLNVEAGATGTALGTSDLSWNGFIDNLSKSQVKIDAQVAKLNQMTATFKGGQLSVVLYAQSMALLANASASSGLAGKGLDDANQKTLASYGPLIAAAIRYDENVAASKDSKKAATAAQKDLNAQIRDAKAAVSEQESGLAALTKMTNEYLGVKNKQADIEADYRNDLANNAVAYEKAANGTKLLHEGAQGELRDLQALNAANDAAHDKMLRRQQDLDDDNNGVAKAAAQQTALTNSYDKLIADMDLSIDSNLGVAAGLDKVSAAQKAVVDWQTKAIASGRALSQVDISHGNDLQQTADVDDASAILAKLKQNDPFSTMTDQIGKLQKAIKDLSDPLSKTFNPDKIAPFKAGIDQLNIAIAGTMAGAAGAALTGIQSLTKEGSKSFEILNIAAKGLAITQAVLAVISQGALPPPASFVAIAGMIAIVAPLLASIGASIGSISAVGDGGSSSAASRQASQGTGTVLGDPTKQSESIANSVKITADASEQLVGLNRGMLTALQALEDALGAAGNQLARGAGNASFATPSASLNIGDPFGKDPLGGALGNLLFGGKQKIIDQGIIIAGGALNDMLNKIVVGAYQTVKTSGGLFGGGGTSDQVVDLSSTLGKQFQLVIGSIVDAVKAAATALGLLPADIQKAIDEYKIAEVRISLQGLSADDQQKALEAVFSSIFDGLAAAVVPFIGQFQQVGEGLGETLIRVATEVQVTQEAFKQLGLAVDETDPEKFAQISDALIQAAGGLDNFIAEFTSFVSKFASSGDKLGTDSDALNSALGQVGLKLPATRDGFWQLMQSLDATTESGREQIATLLRLGDTADDYYSELEKLQDNLNDALQSLGGVSDFQQKILGITNAENQAIESANLLAIAQGAEGASAYEAARIHRLAAEAIAEAVAALRQELNDELGQLYNIGPSAKDATTQQTRGISSVGKAASQMYQDQLDALKKIQDFLNDMQYGALSGLSPEQQLEAAQKAFYDMQQKALGGDPEAMAGLADAAKQYLTLAQGALASGQDYNDVYNTVREMLQAVVGRQNGRTDPGAGAGGGGGGGTAQSDAQEQEINRRELANQLVSHLHDLSKAINEPIADLMKDLHIPIDKLVKDLGIDITNMTGATVTQLAGLADSLGEPLSDLVAQLGLSLPDLGAGVRELAASLGIDLTNLSSTTVGQLANLAGSLGTNLATLGASLGIDLGSLSDINSPMFLGLKSAIDGLTPDQAATLKPYFDAVATATDAASSTAAVAALQKAIQDNLPANIANSLQPFFATPSYQVEDNQLTALEGIHTDVTAAVNSGNAILQTSNNYLRDIATDMHTIATGGAGIQSASLGLTNASIDYSQETNAGRIRVDNETSNLLRNYGLHLAQAQAGRGNEKEMSHTALLNEMKAMRAEISKLRGDTKVVGDKVATATNAGHTKTAQAIDNLGKSGKLAPRKN